MITLAAVSAAIWILSSDPAPGVLPPLFPGQDKLLHLAEFSVFSMALAINLDLFRKSWFSLAVIGVLWAGLDEIHQAFVPGRDCSTGDFLADCAGIALGFVLYRVFKDRAGRLRRKGVMFRQRNGDEY